ncbi:MAG: hypothetical protein Q8L81_17295 [Bacteroidota bacterium]|nr:hypothetical protein [Bacteroidota bacterium]
MKKKAHFILLLTYFFLTFHAQISTDSTDIFANDEQESKKEIDIFFSKYKIGLYLAAGPSNFQMKANDISQTLYADSLRSISKKNDIALEFGYNFENTINNTISIRTKVTLLGDGIFINYDKVTGAETLSIYNLSLCLPISMVLQTNGIKARGYTFFGPSFAFGLGPDKIVKDKYIAKQFDIPLELGLGLSRKFKKITLCIEAKFSQGIFNLNAKNKTLYAQTIDKLYRQNAVIGLIFRAT